jgi:outer membrane protein assembly factor BamB
MKGIFRALFHCQFSALKAQPGREVLMNGRLFFGMVTFCFMIVLFVLPLHAQLADSPWPMFCHDLRHTGQSSYRGPEACVLAWSYLTGEIVDSSAALGTDGNVYVGSRDNEFYAFRSDGTLAWSFTAGDEIPSPPAVDASGRIYFGSFDDNIYCVGSSGSLRWSYTNGSVFSCPAIATDGSIYTGSNILPAANLFALTSAGAFRWSYLASNWVSSSPAIDHDGRIYFGSLDNNLYAIEPMGALAWSYHTSGYAITASVGTDGRVYIGSGDKNFYAISSGGALEWSFETGLPVSAGQALSSTGAIYIGSEDKNFYGLSSAGALLWSYASDDEIFSSAAVGVDGRLYTGSTDNNIYALNSNGTLLWSYITPFSIWSSPAIGSDGRVYVGANDYNLYVFEGPPTPTPTPTVTPIIDLIPNKTSFSTSDQIDVTANVQPISVPCYPFIRFLMPNGQTLYYQGQGSSRGFKTSPTPYLGLPLQAVTVPSAILGYPALSAGFKGIAPGTYIMEGGAVDATQTTSVNNLIYVDGIDRETLIVQ